MNKLVFLSLLFLVFSAAIFTTAFAQDADTRAQLRAEVDPPRDILPTPGWVDLFNGMELDELDMIVDEVE